MLFPTFVRDANKTATTLMQAAFDNMRATQETMERQRELATKMEMPWKVSWSKGPMPMPNVSYTASSADSTREAESRRNNEEETNNMRKEVQTSMRIS